MLDFIPFKSLVSLKINLGPSFTGIGRIGKSDTPLSPDQIKELNIPWRTLLPTGELFPLLSWHTRTSEFVGRDKEMIELNEWATSDFPIWIKFVVGEGGTGKSRLGAEFAEKLRNDDWAAGFVNLGDAHAFPMKKEGTLLIVDYPEENTGGVTELLSDLATKESQSPLRVLFLTRKTYDNWQEIVMASNAMDFVDKNPIYLGRFDAPSAHRIYHSTLETASDQLDSVPTPLSEKALAEWMNLASENERALFIMAAAVHGAEKPEDNVVQFSGRKVVKTLVDREIGHLIRAAVSRQLKDKYALARILAMAAVADEISVPEITEMIAVKKLPLGFEPDDDIKGELSTAGLLTGGNVRAPKPDIVAAAFAVEVFGHDPQLAPECIWAALEKDIEGGLERIGRLSYDAEIDLGICEPCISDLLAESVCDNIDRCLQLYEYLYEVRQPIGWLKTTVTISHALLNYSKDDEERARILQNLAIHLSALGDLEGALNVVNEAVELERALAALNPNRFEPELATSLNNMSTYLFDTGDVIGALTMIKEAVEIRRKLASGNPSRHNSALAKSLNNLSAVLSENGNTTGALEAVKESVEIRRQIASTNPERLDPELADSLSNMSVYLHRTGDVVGSLKTIEEAVELYHRLAAASPARFESDVAKVLNNLSVYLRLIGDTAEALDAIIEAVELNRKLAIASPARFEPYLALSCDAKGRVLIELGRYSDAVTSFKEGLNLIRPYAEKWPGSEHEKFLKMLEADYERAKGMME